MKYRTNAWDAVFKSEGKVFTEPHEDIGKVTKILTDHGASKVLDFGSGSGRHVVHFAENGFSVFGLDNSPEGITITKKWLSEKGLAADLQLQDMRDGLPYVDNYFDAVISIQVIHHARIRVIKRIVKEIERVSKKGAFLFITVPKSMNQRDTFREIEPNTFIPLDGWEKGLPHHYFTPSELKAVFGNFEISDIYLDSTDHYCVQGTKL